MKSRRTLLVAALVSALPLLGCQMISASIKSPSESVSGSSESIAGSFKAISASSGSGPAEPTPNQTSYRRDLRQYAAAFAQSTGTSEDFLRGVSRIAEDHGVTHWESLPLTPLAIGEGLRDAHLSEAEMDAFVDLIGRDKPAARLALEGYRNPGS